MLCLRDSTGLRETEILLLEGTKSLVCTGTYGKRSDCIRGWAKISNLLVLAYAVLLFTALDFTSITSHIHNWILFFCFGSVS